MTARRHPHIPDEHLPEYEARAQQMSAHLKITPDMIDQFWKVIDRIYQDNPLCEICQHPMVAGQVKTHLSCHT